MAKKKYYSVLGDKLDEAMALAEQIREKYDNDDLSGTADLAADLSDLLLDLEPEVIGD